MFGLSHFLDAHVQQSAILKYLNRVICCDRTLGERNPLMLLLLMDSTRSSSISDGVKNELWHFINPFGTCV